MTPDTPAPTGVRELPDGRVVLPRFFILDEHVLEEVVHGEDGKPLLDANGQKQKRKTHIDRDVLEQIATNNNRRIAETGDAAPVVVGHTKDDKPEHTQPSIIGYCYDFGVEPFHNTGRLGLACTPIAENREAAELFRKYPRRSVELWLSRLEIDPISLLGATSPERDLGLHRFSRTPHNGERSIKYSITDSNPEEPAVADPQKTTSTTDPGGDDSSDGLVEKVIAALQQTKEWQWISSQMQADPGEGEEGDPGMEGMDEGMDPGMDGGDDDDLAALLGGDDGTDGGFDDDDGTDPYGGDPQQQYMGRGRGTMGHYTDNDQYAMGGEEPMQYAAGMAGANAGFLPSGMNRAPQRYQRDRQLDELRMKFARYEERLAAQEAENTALKKERDEAEVDADLKQLFAEGIDFEYEREFDRLVKYSREDRDAELDRMRNHYKRRAPNRGQPAVAPGSIAQTPVRLSRAQDKGVGVTRTPDHQETRQLAAEAMKAGYSNLREYMNAQGVSAATDTSAK